MSQELTSWEATAEKLISQLAILTKQVNEQQQEIAQLRASGIHPALLASERPVSTTRRKMLQKMGVALVAGLTVTGAATVIGSGPVI